MHWFRRCRTRRSGQVGLRMRKFVYLHGVVVKGSCWQRFAPSLGIFLPYIIIPIVQACEAPVKKVFHMFPFSVEVFR